MSYTFEGLSNEKHNIIPKFANFTKEKFVINMTANNSDISIVLNPEFKGEYIFIGSHPPERIGYLGNISIYVQKKDLLLPNKFALDYIKKNNISNAIVDNNVADYLVRNPCELQNVNIFTINSGNMIYHPRMILDKQPVDLTKTPDSNGKEEDKSNDIVESMEESSAHLSKKRKTDA